MPVDVSIIIVNYNTKEILLNCLQSIHRWPSQLACEIIVVDNASTDGSAAAVENGFPEIRLLRNAINCGFAKANNQGIGKAVGKYLLLLNPDTLFVEDAVTPLFNFMERHPEAGMAGGKILNVDGSLQPSYFPLPNLLTIFWIAFFLNRVLPLNHVNGKWVIGHQSLPSPFLVQRLLGACLFVRQETVQKVGGFDSGFFLFSEEEDLCYRILRQGWAIYYFPATSVIHLGGQSAAPNNPRMIVCANESKVRFFRKHYGVMAQLLFRMIWFFALIIRMPSVLRLASSRRRDMFKAYWQSITALFQPMTRIQTQEMPQ